MALRVRLARSHLRWLGIALYLHALGSSAEARLVLVEDTGKVY